MNISSSTHSAGSSNEFLMRMVLSNTDHCRRLEEQVRELKAENVQLKQELRLLKTRATKPKSTDRLFGLMIKGLVQFLLTRVTLLA